MTIKQQLLHLFNLVNDDIMLNGRALYTSEKYSTGRYNHSEAFADIVGVVDPGHLIRIMDHLDDDRLHLLDENTLLVVEQL